MKITLCLFLMIYLSVVFGQGEIFNIESMNTVSTSRTIQNALTPTDSLLQRFLTSVADISNKSRINSVSDNSNFLASRNFQHNQSLISLGYEYGLLRGYIDPEATDPLQVFNVRGDLSISLKNIPFLFSFNYSTWQNPLGVNNFFRITLDHSKFNQLNRESLLEGKTHFDSKLSEVSKNRTQVLKSMNIGEVLLQKFKREMEQQKNQMLTYEHELKKLELEEGVKEMSLENTNSSHSKRDSLQVKYNEAREKREQALVMYDSINKIYGTAVELLGQINQVKSNLSDQREQHLNMFSAAKDKAAKTKGLGIENIRNFELGLSYPKLSGLGNGGVPIQGLNLEIEKNDWYYAICAGIMQNNLMMTTDATYNKFFNTQNLMNQFDFRNIRERGLITQVKFGRGAVEKTHAHISMSYLSNALSSQFGNQSEQLVPSIGLELDLRYVPTKSKNTAIDFIYGKSSRYELVNSTSDALRSVFSDERTHAARINFSQRVEKIRTQFISSFRWIDPFADTRSYGVVQPNHMRIEARTIHHVNRNFRFGLNYRQDLGNIALRSDSTMHLHVAGVFVDGMINEKISFFGSANYVDFQQRSITASQHQVNYMINGGIAASYKLFGNEHNILINMGDNLITDTTSTGFFRTVNIQKSTKLRKGKNTFTLAYFKIDDPSLFQTSAYVVGDELSWMFKKIKVTAGLKSAYNEDFEWNWGGKLEMTIKVAKFAEFVVGAEKLILGDFFNNYNRNLYDTFPYAFMARMNFLIK